MKVIVCLLLALAVVQARDWSKVIPRNAYKPVRNPKLMAGHIGSKITGGQEVTPNSLPYQAGMFISTPQGTFFCGGSLISLRHVLTAAHCTDGGSSIEVILGAHRIRETESTQKRFTTSTFYQHELYSEADLTDDVSIVVAPSDVALTPEIQIIGLTPASTGNLDGVTVLASGWGKPSDSSSGISAVLKSTNLECITNDECSAIYGFIRGDIVCTMGTGINNICSGDSGGPLVNQGKLVGVTSFGAAAGCELGYPAGFSRVSDFLDWIEEKSGVTP